MHTIGHKTRVRIGVRANFVRLSTKGRYAVTAIVDLALHAKGKPVALSDIARRQEISLSYLEQLFAKLRRAGIVKSVRGPGGGYLLTDRTERLPIGDVVLAVDDPIGGTRSRPAKPAGADAAKIQCLTRDLWEALGGEIGAFLGSVTVADVVEGRVLNRARGANDNASTKAGTPHAAQ